MRLHAILTDGAILTQPLPGKMFTFWSAIRTNGPCLHVPAEDGEDDAGVSGDGEEGDGAEERERIGSIEDGGGEGIYDALFHLRILCDPVRNVTGSQSQQYHM